MSKQLNFNVANDPGDDRPTIVADNPPGGTPLEGHFEGEPINRFVVVVPLEITGGATLTFDHGRQTCRVIVPPGEGQWEAGLPPCLPPEYDGDSNRVAMIYGPAYPFPDEAGGLTRSGRYLLTPDGRPWSWRGASAFFALARLRRGEDLAPLAVFHRTHGVNVQRIFHRCSRRTDFPEFARPEQDPRYWNDLLAYNQGAIDRGLRVENTVFTSGHEYTLDEQRAILAKTYEVLSPLRDRVFVEVANEPKPNPARNDIDAPAIAKGINTYGILTALGCYDEGMDDSPVGDLGTMHTARDDQWGRKARHLQEIKRLLAMTGDEPMGVGDVAKPGSRTTDLDELVRYFSVAHCYSMGATLHSDYGIQGQVPPSGPQADAFPRVCAEVWQKVGPEWQTGAYAPSHYGNSPVVRIDGQVWTYSSLLGNRAFTVRCNYDKRFTNESIPLVAKNGWRIVETWGPANHLAFLER